MDTNGDVEYRILHNVDARFSRGYQPGDRLVEGHRGSVAGDPLRPRVTCETVFHVHNRDDRPDGRDAPSLSVGDVVVLGETAWTCASVGFEPVAVAGDDVHPGPYREVARTF